MVWYVLFLGLLELVVDHGRTRATQLLAFRPDRSETRSLCPDFWVNIDIKALNELRHCADETTALQLILVEWSKDKGRWNTIGLFSFLKNSGYNQNEKCKEKCQRPIYIIRDALGVVVGQGWDRVFYLLFLCNSFHISIQKEVLKTSLILGHAMS